MREEVMCLADMSPTIRCCPFAYHIMHGKRPYHTQYSALCILQVVTAMQLDDRGAAAGLWSQESAEMAAWGCVEQLHFTLAHMASRGGLQMSMAPNFPCAAASVGRCVLR
jgi:hypothetical protein